MRGFSRETLVELTTNIESQEYRRRQNSELGYPEHPRAGVTDDLETLYSMCHGYLGTVFTLKQFKERWPKTEVNIHGVTLAKCSKILCEMKDSMVQTFLD